ncbi:hypothetical protein C7270_23650 [Burkholderia thailandensis]|nr:hypothetical protein [Burkholderia thailandensis]
MAVRRIAGGRRQPRCSRGERREARGERREARGERREAWAIGRRAHRGRQPIECVPSVARGRRVNGARKPRRRRRKKGGGRGEKKRRMEDEGNEEKEARERRVHAGCPARPLGGRRAETGRRFSSGSSPISIPCSRG